MPLNLRLTGEGFTRRVEAEANTYRLLPPSLFWFLVGRNGIQHHRTVAHHASNPCRAVPSALIQTLSAPAGPLGRRRITMEATTGAQLHQERNPADAPDVRVLILTQPRRWPPPAHSPLHSSLRSSMQGSGGMQTTVTTQKRCWPRSWHTWLPPTRDESWWRSASLLKQVPIPALPFSPGRITTGPALLFCPFDRVSSGSR
jgi:hypothetical protein